MLHYLHIKKKGSNFVLLASQKGSLSDVLVCLLDY